MTRPARAARPRRVGFLDDGGLAASLAPLMHWVSRIGLAALLAVAIATCPQQVYRSAGADDLTRLEREHAELGRQNDRLRGEIDLLRAEIGALKRDPEEVARIARQDLNMVRPGEIVFEVKR